MTDEQYQAKVGQILKEEYGKLDPDILAKFDPDTVEELVTSASVKRLSSEAELDPELHEAMLQAFAKREVIAYLEEHRPQGGYREDGFIPLSEKAVKEMRLATRADLLAWRELETDPANLAYIDSRFEVWPAEIATLAELERVLFNDGF